MDALAVDTRFKPGHSGNPYGAQSRSRRIAALTATLASEYDPSPSQVSLLKAVATFMDDAERAKTKTDRVRAANAAARLLAQIPKKPTDDVWSV